MSRGTIPMTDALRDYLVSVSVREPEVLARLREETGKMPMGGMQISPEQGQFMGLLIELIGAKKTLEVGVFTGYSSTIVARALPPDGKIIACDVSEEFTSMARRTWQEAGVADKIELRLGPAVETLERLVAEGHGESFDFAFIDADKENYDAYYEAALKLVRPRGLIGIDNTLWGGRVADPAADDSSTVAMRKLNAKLHADARVTISVVPVGDGLTLALKRG